MWKFVLVLTLARSAFCFGPGTQWLLGTLKCSEYRVKLVPNKNLPETPEALDQMCSYQDSFYNCLEDMFEDLAKMSELPPKLQYDKFLFKELCNSGSSWRTRYLNFATCINMQTMDFCKSEKFLGALNGNQNLCDSEKKTTNCIVATLAMMCGIEAGYLFLYLEKLKSDDWKSGKVNSCQDSEKTNEEIYKEIVLDGMFNEEMGIGQISDKDKTEYFLHKREGDSLEEFQKLEDVDIADNSVQDSHIENTEYNSETVENIALENYESLAEVITSAFDALDEDVVSESPESIIDNSVETDSMIENSANINCFKDSDFKSSEFELGNCNAFNAGVFPTLRPVLYGIRQRMTMYYSEKEDNPYAETMEDEQYPHE